MSSVTCFCGEAAAVEICGHYLCYECADPYGAAPPPCPICLGDGRDWCSNRRGHRVLMRRGR